MKSCKIKQAVVKCGNEKRKGEVLNMKKTVKNYLLLFMLMVFAAVSASPYTVKAADAGTIGVGSTVRGSFSEDGVLDYTFTTDSSDSFYEMTIKNASDFYVDYEVWYDADKTVTASCWHNGAERGLKGRLSPRTNNYFNMAKLERNHTYYVKLSGTAGTEVEINLTATLDAVGADSVATAAALPIGETYTGCTENYIDVDFYKFTTDSTDSFYTMDIINVDIEGRVNVAVFSDADLTQYVTVQGAGWNLASADRTLVEKGRSDLYNMMKLEKNHTYYVRVNVGALGSYRLKVNKTLDDVGDSVSNSSVLKLGNVTQKAMQNIKDVDVFKFKAPKYTDYTLVLANTSIESRLSYIVYSGADFLETQKVANGYLGKKVKLTGNDSQFKLQAGKTYYIVLTGDVGKYKIGFQANAPETLKVSNLGKKRAKLTWKKVSKATGYEIYRSTSKKGKYKKVATVKKAGTKSYTDKKSLKKGKTYYYKVRAYQKMGGKTYYTEYTSIKAVKIK